MPSESRKLPQTDRVLVEHPKLGRKLVTRSQLNSARAGGWRRVEDKPTRRRKKTSAAEPDNQSSPESTSDE